MANFKYSVGKCGCSCKKGCGSVPCISAKWYRAIDYSPDDNESVRYLVVPNVNYVNDELNIDLSVDPYVVAVSTDGGNTYSLPSIVEEDFSEQDVGEEGSIQEMQKEVVVQTMSRHSADYKVVNGFSDSKTFVVLGESVIKYDALALHATKSELDENAGVVTSREHNGIIRCPTGYVQLLTNRINYTLPNGITAVNIHNASINTVDQGSDIIDFLENYESGDLGITIEFSFDNYFFDFNLDYDSTVGIVYASLVAPDISSLTTSFSIHSGFDEKIDPVQILDLFCKRTGVDYDAYQNVPEIISGINPFISTLSIDNVINYPTVYKVNFLSQNSGSASGWVDLLNTAPRDYYIGVASIGINYNNQNHVDPEDFDVSPIVTLYNNGFLYDYNEDASSCYIAIPSLEPGIVVSLDSAPYSKYEMPASGKFLGGTASVPENVLEFVSSNYGDYYPVFVKGNNVAVQLVRKASGADEVAKAYFFDRVLVYLFDKFSIKNSFNSMLETLCNKENILATIIQNFPGTGATAPNIYATVSCITNSYRRSSATAGTVLTANDCANE